MNKDLSIYDIRKILKDCLGFKEINILQIEKLGGLTNKNYKVSTNNCNYVLRLPGDGTEQFINRENEYECNTLANKLNIDSELLFFNTKKGIKVTKYIEQAETMSKTKFAGNKELIKEVACIFQKLHMSKFDTNGYFDIFSMINEYENIIKKTNVMFWKDYKNIRNIVRKLNDELNKINIRKTLCHNDPLCENFILGLDRMYLIDWEYSGMNDPMWDLADFIIEADLNNNDELLLCKFYDPGKTIVNMERRISINKVFVDFLWALWALMKYGLEKDRNMLIWANERYERSKKNLFKIIII
ncbi:choline/ethanolamine kinase family protein [Clostridium botulinum]|uniref:choline/ethanolamine kinase family protein n=1 Tax=Clostridium botulinum TaxID=1491 RepID=UPI002490A7B4|nr:choline/ethanolamine kinase family protein [Clostridium botulinum]BDB02549.1 hypothetical protein CBOS2020_26230 [Clostridium botulinum]